MNVPYWLIKYLPYYDYICPKCKKEVKKNSHKCVHCGERYGVPLRVPPYVLKELLKGNVKPAEAYVHKHIFPRVSAFERAYLTKYFTILFENGFEEGDFSAWTSTTGTPTIVETIVHHGTKSAQFNATAEYASKNGFNAATFHLRFYIYMDTASTAVNPQIVDIYAGTNLMLRLERSTGTYARITYRSGTTLTALNSATVTYPLDEWMCIEAKVVIHASAGEYRVYKNGVEIADLTLTSMDTDNYGNITNFNIGVIYAASTIFYIDCVVVADAYIGPEATLQTVADSLGLSDSVLRHKPLLLITDVLGLADAVLAHKHIVVIDALSIADSLLTDKTISVADALAIVDNIFGHKTIIISDALTIGEEINVEVIGAIVKYVTDALSIADSIITNKTILIQDVLSILDAIAINKNIIVTDSLTLADAVVVFGGEIYLKLRVSSQDLRKLGVTHTPVILLKLKSEDANITQRGEDV